MSEVLAMPWSYDYRLVALSVVIAILASYAALDLAGRVSSGRGRVRFLWLSCGAAAMGIGIWSMHYIGMLAYHLPVPVVYDWPTVFLSLLAAIFASAVSLFVVSRREMGMVSATFGSIVMGGGIAAMHYIGMAAMRLPAMHHYSSVLVSVSVILAIVISFVALLLTFHFRGDTSVTGWRKLASALLMGVAIPIMHYTGMAAASFTPSEMVHDMSHAITVSSLGAASIVVMTFMVLALVLVTSFADRRFSLQALKLASSEQRYRQIVETAFDAFVGVDSSGLISDWNAQAAVTFGWSRAEAIGVGLSRMIVLDRDQKGGGSSIRDFLASEAGSSKTRTETMGMHRDGRRFPVELTISAIHLGDRNLFAAFINDVSDRRRTEDELEKAKEAAEAGSRAKSDFLANMSHEIRTPLNGVIGMTALALQTEMTREQREYLETVNMSADSLLTVINDILDFSKIEAGKVDLELTDFNLRDCLETTLKSLAPLADEKGLELLFEIAPTVPDFVRGDSNRLRQVAINLLGNAIKFTDTGEIALNVQVAETEGHDCVLHFSVSDTGVGIPPEKQKLIFEPFSQADNSTTREYGGTGLGLTISARLVRIMGGRIWVESEVGQGTRFHFTARLETADRAVEVVTPASPEILRGIKVLIVDDNGTNRRILEGLLNMWGMRSSSVNDGESALAQLSEARNEGDPYALVLTDMHMPKMDGFNLVEQIRQRAVLAPVIIMMLTSAGHRGDGERCQELGVSAYLLKPVRQSELREAIVRSLGPHAQKDSTKLITRYSLQDVRDPASFLRVLVAEDNLVNQLVATRMIENGGHSVVMAVNGREALEALEKDSFDVVLMDMQMPEMDGFKATELLREKEKQRGDGVRQPVIAVTAHAMKGDRDRCLAAGADQYLTKPISWPELNTLLEMYMERRVAAATAPNRSSVLGA